MQAPLTFPQYCSIKHKICGSWTAAKNTRKAHEYADNYAEGHLNGYYHYYGPSNEEEGGDDCTNYVSQILRNAEMPMLRQYEHGEDDWWTIPAPQHVPFGAAPDHTNNWAVAEALYHHLRETGLAVPLTGSETPHAGDLVFFQWRTPGWRKSTINHMGMIVSGNNNDPAHEIYTSHTANRLIPMTKEYAEIGEFLHEREPKFAPSANQRGRHWEWLSSDQCIWRSTSNPK